ncbi:MAG: hypothetical protein M1813_001588 [Trichoglossum hirsutum]|nr:MAG: hypothetical protein M1813_001588 [Trichoglossum hirsutum]
MFSVTVLALVPILPIVAAASWDDFANNLATDLAPLLALFGEQVTKQYLSESVRPLDNFIFAMAPLGILTAVVSAIRVCGGSSIRAFIGRAQEGRGLAEAELCSSTSHDICELWHNGGIARVFGRPRILELVHDPHDGHFHDTVDAGRIRKPTAGLYPFRQYLKTTMGRSKWKEDAVADDEHLDNFAPNPNLSLNIGIKKGPSWVFWAVALFGLSTQCTVLVFAAWAAYVGRLSKNGQPMRQWAFPATFAGTLLLCGGMFFCSFLVERSTRERFFKREKAGQTPPMYWLQAGGQVVGDQTFSAFAHRECPEEYTTSWKLDHERHTGIPVWALVWIAVGTTMTGFVLQFVGFRGMHAAVSTFQLGAILVMALLRAGLRIQRLGAGGNELADLRDHIQGHELDWLAMRIGKDFLGGDSEEEVEFWEIIGPLHASNPVPEATGNQVSRVLNNRVSLSLTTAGNDIIIGGIFGLDTEPSLKAEQEWITQLQGHNVGKGDGEISSIAGTFGLNHATRVMKYRARLARLTGSDIAIPSHRWPVEAREQAKLLKRAIERTIEIIFEEPKVLEADWRGVSTIIWAIRCGDLSSKAQSIYLTLCRCCQTSRGSHSSAWSIDESELEAVLGLWSWSLNSEASLTDEHELVINRIFALATGKEEIEKARTDLKLWVRGDAGPVKEDTLTGIYFQGSSRLEGDGRRYFGWQAVTPPPDAAMSTIISVATTNSLLTMCAQEVFVSFIHAIANIVSEFGGETSARGDWQDFRLCNTQLDRIAAAFEESRLGSREDAYMSIVPPLRTNSKLPSHGAYESARAYATTLRGEGDWKEAEKLLKWIYSDCFAYPDRLTSAATDLGEFYRQAMRDSRNPQLGYAGILWMLEERSIPLGVGELYGWVAWRIAIEHKNVDMEQSFRKADGYMLEEYEPNTTILQAIKIKNKALTLLLLREGLDLEESDLDDRDPLSLAVSNGWAEVVRSLLELGAEIDRRDKSGRTALSYAAKEGAEEIVRLLMVNGASPNAQDSSGRTPLSYAVEEGNEKVIHRFMTGKHEIKHLRDGEGRTPLMWAVLKGHESVALLLVEKGAKVDGEANNGLTALQVAAMGGFEPVVRLLLDKRADIEARGKENGWTALHQAVQGRYIGVVRLLLEEGADVNSQTTNDGTVLHIAARGGHESLLRLLLEKAASIEKQDKQGRTALNWAAFSGHESAVRLLLELGADIEAPMEGGSTVLQQAAYNGHKTVLHLLLEKGADIEAKGYGGGTALNWAASRGHEQAVRLLLERGANIGTLTDDGSTVLQQAAYHGHTSVVLLLLEHGATIDTRNPKGRTALNWAAFNGHESAVRLLLEHGADIEAPMEGGSTVLQQAAHNGHTSVMLLLLEHSASIETRGSEGRTALNWAVFKGHESAALLLLERGADIEAPMEGGSTVLQQAAYNGHIALLELLLGFGASINAKGGGGRTALTWAAHMGNPQAVRLLLTRGADDAITDDQGWTALETAIQTHHIDVVKEFGPDAGSAALERARTRPHIL